LPISQHELGFSGVYGQQAFLIDDGGTESDPTVPGADPKLVPDVVYSFIRLGTDFSYIFSKYTLRADVGLRIVNSAGEEAGQIQNDEWFPNSDVGGVDVGLTAGYAVSERFTVTLGADFRNFFYSMNSREADFGIESGDRNPVAGGANDMYFAGMLMASYALQ
jgi:hypothetical protein